MAIRQDLTWLRFFICCSVDRKYTQDIFHKHSKHHDGHTTAVPGNYSLSFVAPSYKDIMNLIWFEEFLDARTFPGQETEGGCLACSLCHYYAFLNCAEGYSFKTILLFQQSQSQSPDFSAECPFLSYLLKHLHMASVLTALIISKVLWSYHKCLKIFLFFCFKADLLWPSLRLPFRSLFPFSPSTLLIHNMSQVSIYLRFSRSVQSC